MGKGGGSQPSQVSQVSIPEYAKPYVERMLGRTEALVETPTPQYQGQAFADPTAEQMQARQRAANLQLPEGFKGAQQMVQEAGSRALQASQYNPYQFRSPYMSPVRQFTAAEARAYENPFIERVLNVRKRKALEDAQKTQLGANLGAARRGTYGGARQALLQAERERGLGEKLDLIESTGRKEAFEDAAKRFEAERKAQMSAEEFRAKQILDAQKATELSRQFGAGLGLKGLEQLRAAGVSAGDISKAETAAELNQLKLQAQIAREKQIEEQRRLDYEQQQFQQKQKDAYKREQFMSDILRGTGTLQGGEALYTAPQTALQQIVGTGLPAYGLYRGLSGQP